VESLRDPGFPSAREVGIPDSGISRIWGAWRQVEREGDTLGTRTPVLSQ